MPHHAVPMIADLAAGNDKGLNPVAAGVGALVVLLLLLFITTRFNKDR